MTYHDEIPLTERHAPHNWEFANAAARNAFTGYDAPIPVDVKKDCLQLDDNSVYKLINHSPVTWVLIANPAADVAGPASSADNAIARFNGVTGKVIQNSLATVTDGGDIDTPGNITLDGTVDGVDVAGHAAATASHISNSSNPHTVTADQVGRSVAQWNADKLHGRDIQSSAPGVADFLGWNPGTNRWEPMLPPGAGGGEANTSPNGSTGGGGIDINLPKAGLTLPKKGIAPGSAMIAVTDDLVNKNVKVDAVPSNISHQALGGAGTYDHAALDVHVNNAVIHFTEGSIDHDNIQNNGSNDHAAIDSHIGDAGKHREINDSGSGVTDLWSANKITAALAAQGIRMIPIITTLGSNYGAYRSRSMAAAATYRFNLAGCVPASFERSKLIKAVLVFASVSGMTAASIDVTTEYGSSIGAEPPDNHTENGVEAVTVAAGNLYELDIEPYITNLDVADSLGIEVSHLAVGSTNHFLCGAILYAE